MKASLIAALTLITLAGIFVTIGISHGSLPGRTPNLVNDYAGVLSESTKQYLEGLLKYERDKGPRRTEVVVTLFKSTGGKNFDDFFRQYLTGWWRWSIAENHNRVQVVIITDEGKMRIGVGRALDNIIDTNATDGIMRKLMLPGFSTGEYSAGTRKGVEAIVRLLEKQR